MRELPRSSIVKFEQRKLIPDGNPKKPPIANGSSVQVIAATSPPSSPSVIATNVVAPMKKENNSVRESIVSDISSSRPNSTASDRSVSTDDDDDDENGSTTECSESCQDAGSSEEDCVGDNRTLEPISEETSQRKKTDEDDGLLFSYI